MDITEALEVADRWRNQRVIVVGKNALPYAVVKLADAYKSQAAEIERLRAERDKAVAEVGDIGRQLGQAQAEADRLRADAERYRGALEDIASHCIYPAGVAHTALKAGKARGE